MSMVNSSGRDRLCLTVGAARISRMLPLSSYAARKGLAAILSARAVTLRGRA